MAAPSDLAGIDRVWELSIRGATTRDEPPALEEDFDGVRVRMWPVSTDDVLYDFVENVEHAEVELVADDGSKACPWVSARPARGGLGRGPMTPEERFVCDPRRPWLWVGATVMQDLELQPRRCIWQHPAGSRARPRDLSRCAARRASRDPWRHRLQQRTPARTRPGHLARLGRRPLGGRAHSPRRRWLVGHRRRHLGPRPRARRSALRDHRTRPDCTALLLVRIYAKGAQPRGRCTASTLRGAP